MDIRTRFKIFVYLNIILLLILYLGCGRHRLSQVYVNPNMNFKFIKKVAVLPFDTLAKEDRLAGKKFRDIFVTTLLATETIEVPELGDIRKALQIQGLTAQVPSIPGQPEIIEPFSLDQVKTDSISSEMAKSLGQVLGVQGIILGSVDEYSIKNSTSGSFPEVSVSMRMIDSMTGSIIWSISHTEKGSLILPSILGVGEETVHETAIKAARRIVETLVYTKGD